MMSFFFNLPKANTMTTFSPMTRFGNSIDEIKPYENLNSDVLTYPKGAPRDLTEEEVAQVTGGITQVGIGASIGAIYGGAQFLMTNDKFSWGGFAFGIGSGAVSGSIASMGGFAFAFYGGGLGALGGVVANKMR